MFGLAITEAIAWAQRQGWRNVSRAASRLHDEHDDAARARADAEARMREALDDRDDADTRAEKAEAAIARVRALHVETERGNGTECGYCISPWPCDTLAALDWGVRTTSPHDQAIRAALVTYEHRAWIRVWLTGTRDEDGS